MKKITVILILVFIVVLAFKPGLTYAWDDCVFDKVNDEYPGDCSRYIDTDNDGICDHSQPAPEDRVVAEATTQKNAVKTEQPASKQTNNYYPSLIAFVLIISYGISFFLTKKGKLSLVLQRKLWNIGLTLTFLLNGISGMLLVIRIAYGVNIDFFPNMLFWHVETGIVLVMIAIFHVLWHISYYKSLLK